ncbi:MAG TPA: hypothetical protein VL994_08790 [Steroidobacteraceae bacterium]|nr:hypothetical protein [Steroidobacteraceae bacterium]
MRWLTFACIMVVVGCVNSPPIDNPSAPGEIRPASDERVEARQLERAEADCAAQGKHAVARRDDGVTVYDCAG